MSGAGGVRHRSTTNLKQRNKKHKTGSHVPKGTVTSRVGAGRVEGSGSHRPSIKQASGGGRLDRMNKAKQMQLQKREKQLLMKRQGGGVVAPKVVVVLGLGESADLPSVCESVMSQAANKWVHLQQGGSGIQGETGVFSTMKQRLTVLAPTGARSRDLQTCLEAARMADIVVLVLPLHDGVDGAIDKQGDLLLSGLRAQGMPAVMGVSQGLVQGAGSRGPKALADAKKFGMRAFRTELGEGVKTSECDFAAAQQPGASQQLKQQQQQHQQQLLRLLCSMAPSSLGWRDARAHLVAQQVQVGPQLADGKGADVQLTGFLRGRALNVNQLVHVGGVGTFRLRRIESAEDPCPLKARNGVGAGVVLAEADPSLQEDLKMEAVADPLAGEQTWPTEQELEEADANAKGRRKGRRPEGMSAYQASWLVGDEDEEQDEDGMQEDGDVEEEEEKWEDYDEEAEEEEEAARKRNHRREGEDELGCARREQDEHREFPDEIDTPEDCDARVRFARYRGLKSFRTSPWDVDESLPQSYATVHRFRHFSHVTRRVTQDYAEANRVAVQKALPGFGAARSRASSVRSRGGMEEDEVEMEGAESLGGASEATGSSDEVVAELARGMVLSGERVTLVLAEVGAEEVAALQTAWTDGKLVTASALMRHENKLSVLHFSVTRHPSYTLPIRNKAELVFYFGFRRVTGRALFSENNLNGDKHKMLRFLPEGASAFSVASVFGPVAYAPAPVSVYIEKPGAKPIPVAFGGLIGPDPDRVVLKKIVLSGHPVKVKKRSAVVKHMFYNPKDVRWFAPVEMFTKHGLTGVIRDTVGTHGSMKCYFNKPIKQHDTVCMSLYKRVYPKMPEEDAGMEEGGSAL